MSKYIRPGRRTSPQVPRDLGKIQRVPTVEFCESTGCSRLADWRIGYGLQSVDLCSRHALATMRNRRVWSGWF